MFATAGTSPSQTFLVGAGPFSFTVRDMNASGAPLIVEFGINDCFTDDNSGYFDAMVDV